MARSDPQRDLAALRLAAQGIAAPSAASPADVVRRMLAIQAQDFGGAKWSVGLRAPGSTDAAVEQALAAGEIVRSWPMRGTLHFVAPEDLGWMLGLSGPRQNTWAAKRRGDLAITDAQLALAGDLAADALRGGRGIRRDRLLETWERAGIATTGQRAAHLIWNLAHGGLIVFGPVDGKQQTFRLLEEWVAAPRRLEGDEALAEFARRYFTGHGPATERDFAWWASITLKDARTGIAGAAGLERREIGGVQHWLAAGLEPAASGVHALPGFDEYLLGYRDRSAVLAAEYAPRIVPGNNGMFLPTIIVDGRVVGTWKRTATAKRIRVQAQPFEPVSARVRAGFSRAIAGYAAFAGVPIEVDWADPGVEST